MKIIGIVGRVYYNKDNQKIIQLNDFLRRTLANYKDVVSILLLPTNKDDYLSIEMGSDKIDKLDKEKLDYLLDMCDGFVVPGGTQWYKFDEYVIKYAMDKKKPLLAICAGFQCLCSMCAMKRNKFDMTEKLKNDKHYGKPEEYIHRNIIIKDTLLGKILGKDIIKVNSVHHDYIDFSMVDLKVASISEDNIIEAVELPNHPFLIGIGWHPEYLMDNEAIKIFDYFINTMKKI